MRLVIDLIRAWWVRLYTARWLRAEWYNLLLAAY